MKEGSPLAITMSHARETLPRPRPVGIAAALLVLVTVGAAPHSAATPAQFQGQAEDGGEVRSFAIPETSLAKALVEKARDHIAAERWSDAIQALQTLIEDHRGELTSGRHRDIDGRWRSQQLVHPGACAEAARLLAGLPDEARQRYVDRYGHESRAALERALGSGDRAALAEVARRYPLTEAAREAWWALGDLELELGQLGPARASWARAAALSEAAGAPLSEGAHARLAFVFPAEGVGTGGANAPTRAATPPGSDAQTWRVRLDEGYGKNPFFATRGRGEQYNLLPVLADDTLFVCDSMTLRAYDAWTGRLRWASPEAPGWRDVDSGRVLNNDGRPLSRSDFFEAIDLDGTLVAPAVSGRVAVAALQIPVTHTGKSQYRRIRITTIIPDRRLFAFDRETGRELWNHMPPADWDGERGEFEDRMRVAGPPVIAGSRILVPCYRLQGRVDYHVACYDLWSGERLWSTGVISGQLPLNMFGRHAEEFAAAPLVVEGETVLALTQLGAIAALDLFSGDILWETLYDSIPLPANEHQWQPPRRRRDWNNAAPLVAGGVLLAGPTDSTDLVALDIESGAMVWSMGQKNLVGSDRSFSRERWTLFGAVEDTLYLSGSSIVSWRAPGGLDGTQPPSELMASQSFSGGTPPPRATLNGRWIVAPTASRRVVLDRLNLRFEDRRLSLDWEDDQEPGNALLADGALFMLSSRYLSGTFDWEVQQQRFEEALTADPGNHDLAFAYGDMLMDRARTSLGVGGNEEALRLVERARRELEARLDLSGSARRERASKGLYVALRLEAEALARTADVAGALRRLEAARALVPTTPDLRNTLLEIDRLLQVHGETERRFAVLDDLEARCAALAMPVTTDMLERASGDVFAPPSPDGQTVGEWVLLERAHSFGARERVADELAVLHRVLAEYGDVPLSSRAPPGAEVPSVGARIEQLVETYGRHLYAPYEARARELYRRSIAERDARGLDEVVALYPLADAARDAAAARLEQAFEDGETGVLARLVQARLSADWTPESSSSEELGALVKLASSFGAKGNLELEAGLLERLARAAPAARTDGAGSSLRELAEEARARAAPAERRTPVTFDAEDLSQRLYPGRQEVLGRVPRRAARADEPELLVLARSDRGRQTLFAVSSEGADDRQWSRSLDVLRPSPFAGQRSVVLPTAAVVAMRSGLVALDPDSGAELWTVEFEGEGVEALGGAGGVVVASLVSTESGARLAAFDARGGIQLWTLAVERGLHLPAVVSPECAVLLPREHDKGPAWVLDLFTGRTLRRLQLKQGVGDADLAGCWIEDGRLILPGFPRAGSDPRPAPLHALDLTTGAVAWTIEPEERRELDSIVRFGRSAYLILLAAPFSGETEGRLLDVNTRGGGSGPVAGVTLGSEDYPIGIQRGQVVQLDQPYLYLLQPALGSRESLVRQVHLTAGPQWAYRLSVPSDELFTGLLPLPTHSASTVALAYTVNGRSRGGRADARTSLLMIDRQTGFQRETRILPDSLGRADSIRLMGLGPSLIVQGRDGLLVLTKD